MHKKLLLSILFIFTFIYATETNTSIPTTDKKPQIVLESNITVLENNLSNEQNQSTIQKDKVSNTSNFEQIKSQKKNFNMTKGNSKQGQEIFTKNLQKKCHISSYKFATNYSQDKWEEIAESGRFRETLFKICIHIREIYQNNWSPDLYQFAYEHANDS